MKHIIGVAEMRISANQEDSLTTYALGSCLGITVYDPVAWIGGMVHVMLPLSTLDPAKAGMNPCMFVDTGVTKLFLDCYKAGARKERLVVKAAGGACVRGDEEADFFQIGKRNFVMLRKLLWKNGVLLKAFDVGGTEARTMSLDIATGEVILKVNGNSSTL